MFTRLTALTAGLTGAATGIAVLVVVFALAAHWYATPISPLILLLTPGSLVGFFNPTTELWWVLVVAVQAASYALVAIVIAAAVHRVRRRSPNAV